MINISLQSEYIMSVFGLQITNTFFTSVCVTVLLSILALFFYFKKGSETSRVGRMFGVMVYELLALTDRVTGSRSLSKKILPLIATFFVFIVAENLLGLLPGFFGSFFIISGQNHIPFLRSPNSDLTITAALAIISVCAIQFFSVRTLGIKKYIGRFINFTNPIAFILGFFEIIAEAVKVLSFSFRLFGNLFAGEVLLLVIGSLVPYILPVPFMVLEVFVGVIQAFIFSILTLTFIKTSTIRHVSPV